MPSACEDRSSKAVTAAGTAGCGIACGSAASREEAAALGDEALSGQAAGLSADPPRITRRLGGSWRRDMARSFDGLASDIAADRAPLPRRTGEELALHLAIRRAEELLQDRPGLVAERIADLRSTGSTSTWMAHPTCFFKIMMC
ncbi:hypothetical protein ACFWA9_00120 [Kitasatospora sp. NPDC059973]|uniref:hypothetical protein n=1 Tax=Kitasatospora sp. NPDC059973 TaxID=3347020 RepID=UPI00367B833D